MSDHSLYNLNTTYPFIWKDGVFPDKLKAVRDLRFVYAIPANVEVPSSITYTLKLMHLTSKTATIWLSLPWVTSQVTVPVITDSDANAAGGSFVIIDQSFDGYWWARHTPDGIDIHPDCLVLLQEAPQLSVEVTSKYYIDRNRESQICQINDTVLTFRSGHNVAASAVSQENALTLTLDCGSENGLGIWRKSPWDDKDLPTFDVVGLRSINGVSGDVRILGDASVRVDAEESVETEESEDAEESKSVVILTITGRASEAEESESI